MAKRKISLDNGRYYHVYNRGVEKRDIYGDQSDNRRFIELTKYYKASGPKPSFSNLARLNEILKQERLSRLLSNPANHQVSVVAYCLMPNHFHFLLKQQADNGISSFLSLLQNSYTRYFNTRRERVGPLFQGPFKVVEIDSQEQLVHLVRYIHLNPKTSSLVKTFEELFRYPWSSLPEYINESIFCDTNVVLTNFASEEEYKKHLVDQAEFQKDLHDLRPLTLD